ncbi:MAG: hypothetical protein KJ646_04995 [Nanoarchaeota archaeon]|nr:hypothetical protein [Nanoarchaeota archaeon]MBU4116287.1 hypothetical protein [Nanoarchaeota archaeon]
MKQRLSTLLLLLPLTALMISSCASGYNPYSTNLRRIREKPNIQGVFDCKNKAVEDSNYLNERGIQSNIIYGKINNGFHCWEELYDPKANETYVRDSTWWVGSKLINQCLERKNARWLKFKKGATVEDIKKFNNIEEIYGDNVPFPYLNSFKAKMRSQEND